MKFRYKRQFELKFKHKSLILILMAFYTTFFKTFLMETENVLEFLILYAQGPIYLIIWQAFYFHFRKGLQRENFITECVVLNQNQNLNSIPFSSKLH